MSAALNGYQGATDGTYRGSGAASITQISREYWKQYGLQVQTELLTGSMAAKEKRLAYERIESGKVQIIIGTHALIQEKVSYHRLAFVVTDEQHRFGVRQREALAGKGKWPHILVMSATPIPADACDYSIRRSGYFQLSMNYRRTGFQLKIVWWIPDIGIPHILLCKKQIAAGRQCYIICPMVEESEHLEAENVLDYARELQKA